MVEETIRKNKSLKQTNKSTSIGRSGITSLNNKQGRRITNQEQLLNRIKEFYEQLYSCNRPIENIVLKEDEEEIPDITPEEVRKAIQQMKSIKAPGMDGLEIKNLILYKFSPSFVKFFYSFLTNRSQYVHLQ